MSKQESSLWKKICSELSLRVWLICLLIVLAVLFLIVVFDECPRWTSQYLGISKKDEALKFLGIGMGGVLLALQALIANRRAKAMESSAEAQARAANAQADAAKAQADATKEQAKANQNTEKGQRQERLKNAIEHLGHDKDSVRLGGAYELFHLAEDTKDLRQTILDILCAHIRQTTGESKYRAEHKSKPSEEVQSLLTLLFMQAHEVFKGLHVNLQGSWLNGVNLNGARLERAVLIGAYLQGAQLENSHLREADLTGTRMTLANLREADLRKANFRKAHLQGARLLGARLQSASLYWVQMQGVELIGARMQGASLYQVQMQAADLCQCRLQLAILGSVELQAALLGKAQLQEVSFQGVQLGGVESLNVLSVEERIRHGIGRQGSLVGVIFQGGMSEQEVDAILEDVSQLKDMSHEEQNVSRVSLRQHIDKPESHQPPEGSSVDLGPYTAEEAEKWIAEYNEAMSEVPEENDN